MDYPEPKPSSSSSLHLQPHQILQQSMSTIQSISSSFIKSISTIHLPPFPLPNPSSVISNLQNDALRAIQTHFAPSHKNPDWARISVPNGPRNRPGGGGKRRPMSAEDIERRLEGVPVYTMSNSEGEIVLVKNVHNGKSLGLLCFREDDAVAILEEMRSMDSDKLLGSTVVPVALNKVIQLKVEGVAFRFVPEASQVVNALQEKKKASSSDEAFPGIPIFQSRNLTLLSQNKRYLPLFFRKEDLEKSLQRARKQKSFSFPLREGDIEVAALEEIIKGMKDASCSKWDDVVFVPPGYDVSTDVSQLGKLGQKNDKLRAT